MRTTLTLDDDVASLLKKEIRKSGMSLKAAVNHYLRLGITTPKPEPQEPFVVTPIKLGLPPGLSYDKISELLEAIEGPEHR